MICSNCGNECSESAKFCRYCGAKLTAAKPGTDLPIVPVTQQAEADIREKTSAPKNDPEPKKKKWLGIIAALIVVLIIAIVSIKVIKDRNAGSGDVWSSGDMANQDVGSVSSAGEALQIYNDLLSGEAYGEFLSDAGIDYVTTDETSFALATINNDDIPELVLNYYDDVYVISIADKNGSNNNSSSALIYCRGYESWELQKLCYFNKNDYIVFWQGGASYATILPYTEGYGKGARLFEKNEEEEGTVYIIYNYDPTVDMEGGDPKDVSEDEFYSELWKTVDEESYSEMEFHANTPEERAKYLTD